MSGGSARRIGLVAAVAGVVLIGIPGVAGARLLTNTFAATGVLGPQGRTAEVIVLVECTAGERLHVEVTLTQGGVFGRGEAAGRCTGQLAEYPVRVAVRGAGGFSVGQAEACGFAVDRAQGRIVDTRQWCRAGGVQLVVN
jgi:hypothetical protein